MYNYRVVVMDCKNMAISDLVPSSSIDVEGSICRKFISSKEHGGEAK